MKSILANVQIYLSGMMKEKLAFSSILESTVFPVLSQNGSGGIGSQKILYTKTFEIS